MAKVPLRAYNREIETMIDRGQLDEAIAHCHHILKIFPKHLETYRLLGKAFLETKRYGDAADIFLRILASVPNDFVAQVGMSIIRDEENKLDDAIWHMERAFETQPSNPAIQSELQRLYGRRDGVQPPRIRMTRGALAHMYLQGELYPQALSEIKSVLKDDAGRFDMQALLARANYKSGLKNEAADVASALLRRYPYSLDANRVLADILGTERPENAQVYRQRVIELDPYASQVTGTMFLSNEVPDAAVSLERLDWNGQAVSMQSDWSETKAIKLEDNVQRDEQPDWLKNSFNEPPPSKPTPASMFESSAPSESTAAQPAEDIPDFLRAAGWGQSTGAFDESKSAFAEESPAPGGISPLAQGDLPDWVKAMKPAEPEPDLPAPAQEEELPDWINNIGKGALSTQPTDQPDWMSDLGQPSAPQTSDQPDWMNQPEQAASAPVDDQLDWMNPSIQSPSTPAADDTPDWLKGLGSETESTPSALPSNEPDWFKGFGSEADLTPQPAQTDTPDWLKGLGEPEPAPAQQADQSDWLDQFGTKDETPAQEPASTDFDFLNKLTEEPVLQTPDSASSNIDNLGVSEQERDDSFAWLENLAAKQGATEGLLTKPEERLEEEPEWVKQAKGLSSPQPSASETPITPPIANVEELGKSEQEQDDSFAWLENLAAKQGATEGLLTKPEERLEQEPEWVRQAKGLEAQPPSVPPTPPAANVEELGKSDQERDDSFAWLENLAAKQGATEGLLTKPEERLEEEPEWVKQAKGLSSPQEPVAAELPVSHPPAKDDVEEWLQELEGSKPSEPASTVDETGMWLATNVEEPAPTVSEALPAASVEELGKSEQEQDDSFAWLENLAAKQGATEGLLTKPEDRLEQEPEWVRQAKDLGAQQSPVSTTPEPQPEQPSPIEDTAAWLRSLDEEEKPTEPAAGFDETAMWLKSLDREESEQAKPVESNDMPAWMKSLDEEESPAPGFPVPAQNVPEEPVNNVLKLEGEDIPSWLADLDKEEKSAPASADDDLPAWLRAEESAPTIAEPTRPTDWKPVETTEPDVTYSPPLEETQPPKIIYSPPLEEEISEPAPEPYVPPVPAETHREESFELPRERPVEPRHEEPAPEPRPAKKAPVKPTPVPEPYKEPVTRARGTGMLVMPGIDPMLGLARNELSRSNIPGALESYGKLIKKGRYLDEVIYDLRDALYRYPVEVSIWQSLGDAYMRANRLQDALDAYTKAEELLR